MRLKTASDMTNRFTRALHDLRGVAAVEFALLSPVLILLIINGIELVHYAGMQMKINRIAVMVADNAGRPRTTMTESYVNQLFTGVDKAGAKIKFKNKGRVILSSVQNNEDDSGQWLRWQRCFGNLGMSSAYGTEGLGRTGGGLPSVKGLTASPGSAIMLVELTYMYDPLFKVSIMPSKRMKREAAYVVRQRVDLSISGTGPARC